MKRRGIQSNLNLIIPVILRKLRGSNSLFGYHYILQDIVENWINYRQGDSQMLHLKKEKVRSLNEDCIIKTDQTIFEISKDVTK